MELNRNNLFSFWSSFIGYKNQFTMEARIFHAITILAVFTAALNMGVNFSLGLTFYGLLAIPLILILIFGYYLSRYRNKLNQAVIIFAIVFNLLCGATYFTTEGSGSVNLFTFILVIFILSLLYTKKQFALWIPVNILFVIALFVLEYFRPELAKPLYQNKQDRLLDIAQTWIEVVGMIAIVTMYIQKNYNQEKELAQSRLVELAEINETKSKLFSIVAHDLRAPLASVESYLSQLNNLDLNAEEKKTIEQQLLNSTRQTSEMLQNILYWSNDQMQGITVNLSPVFLYETLQQTLSLQQTLAKEKGISLTFTIDEHLKVIADVDMLELIIRNLLNNAIKFSLPASEIKLSTQEKDNRCIILISDNGIGINDENIKDIFSLKNKGSYGTHKEKGIGLGLVLAKTYIELQHGEIWFKNNIEGGTTFYVSLDLA